MCEGCQIITPAKPGYIYSKTLLLLNTIDLREFIGLLRKIIAGIILLITIIQNLGGMEHPATSFSSVVISRLEGDIVFDGIPDEEAWNSVEAFPMITHSPVFGKEPAEKTIVKAVYDENYIYFGASLYVSDPDLIRSATRQRDDKGGDSDIFGVVLDGLNDKQTASLFYTTPEGTRTDMEIFNDGLSYTPEDQPFNVNWNTFWDVKTKVSENGWFTEMRIPVSSLRFQENNGEVIMGMIIFRSIPALAEKYIYPAIPNEFGEWSHYKVSLAEEATFMDMESDRSYDITPYVSLGMKRSNSLNETGDGYDFERDLVFNPGLDLKFGVGKNFTMDVTVNTDFSTVEADDEQVNITRFDLYYEEKRQFFLERSNLLDFRTGGPTTMFYSRRIGLDDDLNPVPVIGGIRLTGRTGPLDIGFLNMQTAESVNLPSENFGVLRMKRKVFNPRSYIGYILTSRVGMDGRFNEVYGVDALINLKGDTYLDAKYGQSFESGLRNGLFAFENTRFHVGVDRRRNVGLIYNFVVGGVGKNYNPGIGYQNRFGFWALNQELKYRWLMKEESPVFMHGPYVKVTNYINPDSSRLETSRNIFEYGLATKSDWKFKAGFTYYYDNIFESFSISDDVDVPVGLYNYITWLVNVRSPKSNLSSIELEYKGGPYFDGFSRTYSVMPFFSVSAAFKGDAAYIYNRVDFEGRGQQFTAHIARLRALYMVSTSLSISAYVQYNTAINGIQTNFRLRYNPREGNDLYIVFNHGANTDRFREIPALPKLNTQLVSIKYNYTFRL